MAPENEGISSNVADRKEPISYWAKLGITVEPFGFLFVTATFMQIIVTQNLYLFKVCTANFGFSAKSCDVRNQTLSTDQHNGTQLINQIQSYVSSLHIYGSLIEHIPSIFFVLFIGPFSDKHGRKILMIAPLTGKTLSVLINMANYYAVSLPAEYLLFAEVPAGLLGGMITFIMAVNNYIVDITSEKSRTLRLSVVAGMIGIAVPVSQFISVPIYTTGGYLAIWLTAIGFYVLALVYLIFFVTDSRGTAASVTQRADFTSVSVVENLWQCFTVTFRRRQGYKRAIIVFLLACVSFNLFSSAQPGVEYLYTRNKFSWNQPDFAAYIALFSLVQVLGTLVVLPLLSGYLGLADGLIGIISLIGITCSFLLMAFATSSRMVYLSSLGHILAFGIMVVIRSMLSKTANSDELSYIYAVAASLESIVPLIASTSLNSVYKATIDTFPGAIFLVEAAVEVTMMIFFIVVLILQKKDLALNKVRPVSR